MAEQKKGCDAIDEAVAAVGTLVDDLGSLMEAGAGALGDIQSKIDEALEKLGEFELPSIEGIKIEYCDYADGSDPDYSTNQVDCIEAGGNWVSRSASSLNLREEISKLTSLVAKGPEAIADGISKLVNDFVDSVPDISDKLKELSPELANFTSNLNLASGPVESCVCNGGNDPLASTQAECEASGGEWVCTTVDGGVLGGLTSAIGSGVDLLTSGVDDVIGSISNIDFGNICDKIPDIQVDECEAEDPETGEKKLSKKVNLFAPMSLVPNESPGFSLPASFPNPPPYPRESCVCSDPFVEESGKDACLQAGGTWQCTIQEVEGGPTVKKYYKLNPGGNEYEWTPRQLTDEQEARRVNVANGLAPDDYENGISPEQVAANRELNQSLTNTVVRSS